MTPTPITETPKVTVKRNVFDLDKFERKSVSTEIELKQVNPTDGLSAVLEVVNGDETEAVNVFNIGYRKSQIQAAKATLANENFVSPKAVSIFAAQIRPVVASMNRELFAKDDKESAKLQLAACYNFLRQQPALVESIKVMAKLNASVNDDEEEDNE